MALGNSIAGMRGSGDWDVPDQRPKHWEEEAFRLNAKKGGNAKLVYFLSKLERRAIRDYEFNLFEDREPTMFLTVNGSQTSADTNIEVTTSPEGVTKAGDRWMNERTQEIIYITENPTTGVNTLSNVVRHWGTTAAGLGMNSADKLVWAGSTYGEGTRAPLALSRNPEKVYNYLEIQKETAKLTGSASEMETRPFKNAWARERELALERYVNKVEWAFLFGARDSTTDAEGNRLTSTNGIYRVLTTNVFDYSSTGVNLTDFEDDLEGVFKYGSMEKLWIGGRRTITIATRLASRSSMGTYSLEDVDRKLSYGLRLKRFYTPHGDFVLAPHELMTRSTEFTKWSFLLDPMYLRLYHMRNRYTKWHPDAELPDEDAKKGYYQGELGLGLALQEVHAVFKGMNQYIA